MRISEDNISQQSSKTEVKIISSTIRSNNIHYNLEQLTKKSIPNLNNQQQYVDEEFKCDCFPISTFGKQEHELQVKRLADMFPHNTSLFVDLATGSELATCTVNPINDCLPTYLTEINLLPFHHFCNIIEPPYINPKGFYQVTVMKNGALTKQIIDDLFYVKKGTNQLHHHKSLSNHIWIQIILKTWAKINGSYAKIQKCKPFEFIRTFSFPDWQVMNPNKQKKQYIISRITKITNKIEYMMGKTKNDEKVGLYGFIPNCAAYVIKGHYQQYGDIFIRVASYTWGGWNQLVWSQKSHQPEQQQCLQSNQFLMPIQQFLNIFHLLYSTSNKYYPNKNSNETANINPQRTLSLSRRTSLAANQIHLQPHVIDYQKYPLNIDSLQKNSLVIAFQLQPWKQFPQLLAREYFPVSISLYLPNINNYDIVRNGDEQSFHSNNKQVVIPWFKIMIGKVQQLSNVDEQFVECMKQSMNNFNIGGDNASFTCFKNSHDYVFSHYFKGYSNQITYPLHLKPGKYFIRIKLQQVTPEYHITVCSTSINCNIRFYDPKVQKKQSTLFLQDCLFKKAVHDRKCITFVNPAKRGSWLSIRNEYENIGYSYLAVHVIKNADNKILINVKPKILKEQGYLVKGHKDMKEFEIVVDSDQNTVIIIKYDQQWRGQGKRVWPPLGISFTKIPRIKTQLSKNNSMQIQF